MSRLSMSVRNVICVRIGRMLQAQASGWGVAALVVLASLALAAAVLAPGLLAPALLRK
jgi:hypothetical protein